MKKNLQDIQVIYDKTISIFFDNTNAIMNIQESSDAFQSQTYSYQVPLSTGKIHRK
jgi:hypothetical protein